MNLGRTVFSQLVDLLPTYQFQLCVDRYQGNRYVKDFSCWDQFLSLAFAQLTYRESLRDIEASLSQYLGPRQRASRLENLRRFRSDPDCHRSRSLPQRTVRRGVVRDRVCP